MVGSASSSSSRWGTWLIQALLMAWTASKVADAIQCYSCKATGSNELEANIHCLENAYLEECEEFYHYYNDVETGKIQDTPDYQDYYYLDGQPTGHQTGPGVQGVPPGLNAYANQPAYADTPELRQPSSRESRPPSGAVSPTATPNKKQPSRSKRAPQEKQDTEYVEYYEYYAPNDTASGKEEFGEKATAKDEHYCYSMTGKGSWESYTVEKGCKKIAYCKAALANKPDWTHPWNFCCDRSRCNVKLVKDTPQRVHGMACRRDDDCIQGHNSRPVCPSFFKSCPRAYHGLVKMECVSPSRTMAALKTGAKYRHLYRDKKCYCSKGYFPKGPICTSSATITSTTFTWMSIAATAATAHTLFMFMFD